MPVLMLTAKGMVDDRVEGLDCGADDLLVKPFSMRELTAPVRALLRRNKKASKSLENLTLGDAAIDFVKMTCRKNGAKVDLSAKEFHMLKPLAEHDGAPVSRDTFLDVVWEYNSYPTTRTVDNHIAMLRSKFEEEPAKPQFILTVRGVGYRLRSTPQ